MVDGRLGSRLWGYHPVAPRPLRYRPFVHCLYFCPSSPEVLHIKQHERPLLVKDGIGREVAGQFGLRFWLPHKSQGSLTCHKSASWDRWLYFPSEGRHAVDFFPRKIRSLWLGSNPWSWVPEASMLITRPPKPIYYCVTLCRICHWSTESVCALNLWLYLLAYRQLFVHIVYNLEWNLHLMFLLNGMKPSIQGSNPQQTSSRWIRFV
jgi:hypothetical protein